MPILRLLRLDQSLDLRLLLQKLFEQYPNRIAMVLLEPARTEEPKDGFLQKVIDLAHRNGALVTLDETISGFRFHQGGAQTLYGVTPDMSCFGKALANGFSLSALTGKREVMELGGLFHNKERVFLLSTPHGAEGPSLQPVRLHLAMALLADHQDEAARTQLEKLRSDELPEDIRNIVSQALDTLRERQSWTFNASGYYRHDKNINDAPRQRERQVGNGKWTFPERKSAHGVHFDISAERRIPIHNGFYGQIEAGINGDWFWDAHSFDDFRLRTGAGVGWQNSRWDISLTPFIQRRIYSNKGYSTNFGTDANISYWLTPRWRLSSSMQAMHKNHDTRRWLNGNQYYGSLNVLFAPNARQYWFAGANAMRSQARDSSDAFKRYGISAGWGQEWGWGMSSRLSGNFAYRPYDSKDFFGIVRKDHEYGATLSLWNRNLYFWGITPRLTFSWDKTKSNHFYYDNHNMDMYLEFSKSF